MFLETVNVFGKKQRNKTTQLISTLRGFRVLCQFGKEGHRFGNYFEEKIRNFKFQERQKVVKEETCNHCNASA